MSNAEKDKFAERLQQEIAETTESNKVKEQQIRDIEHQMIEIKEHVEKMCHGFKYSNLFKLAVASHMQYDEDTQFNENNVTVYLAELEEYISSFITFIA